MALAIWNFFGLQSIGNQLSMLSDTNEMFAVHLAIGVLPSGGVVTPGDFTEASFDGYGRWTANFQGGGGFVGGFGSGDYYQEAQGYNPVHGSAIYWQPGAGVAGSPQTVTGYYVCDKYDAGVWWYRTFDAPVVVDTPGRTLYLPLRVRWRGDT